MPMLISTINAEVAKHITIANGRLVKCCGEVIVNLEIDRKVPIVKLTLGMGILEF